MQLQIAHPSRHYIYYRLSTRTHKLSAVFEDLGAMGILLPQDATAFEAFYKQVHAFTQAWHVPVAFNPATKPFDAATVRFLRQWGIHGMWAKDPDVRKAEEMLYEGQIRYALEVMLLGPLAAHTIAGRIRERFDLNEKVMNTAVVRAFSHYFWDTRAWSPHQWANAIFDWMPKGDKTALLMALRAPKTPVGATMVMAAADGDIEALEPGDMFDVAKHYAWRMFMQHATTEIPSFPRTQAALAAFQIMAQAADASERHRGGSKEILNAIARIGVRQSAEVTATIYDIPAERRDAMASLPSVVDSTAETITSSGELAPAPQPAPEPPTEDFDEDQ
jgi:hypothetical protein